jgi:hypothetical protein
MRQEVKKVNFILLVSKTGKYEAKRKANEVKEKLMKRNEKLMKRNKAKKVDNFI